MNGIKYLFDTNAIISFFQGNPQLAPFASSTSVIVSIISVIEFLSFPQINDADKELLLKFIKKVEVIDLKANDFELINVVSQLRSSFKIKLPDAIIAATAIYKDAVLVTNDKDFSKVDTLKTLNF